ncbi:hypothetical protein C2G38_2100204 [Gigaspora rosea]|uniref:Uncharacterized protein n=1 Tax=Gigaspora rosea TaxID=44941 RepID=A0A397V006_9GLOM|nr:hypothetical protein C2G38_2100204 [Gigaspora rosea]
MHVEKTHGCHPSGTGCDRDCGDAKIIKAIWYPGVLEITVNMSYYGEYPQAYGHFTFHDDSDHNDRLIASIVTNLVIVKLIHTHPIGHLMLVKHLKRGFGMIFGFQYIGNVILIIMVVYDVFLMIYTTEIKFLYKAL